MFLISNYKNQRIHEIIQNIDGPIKLYDSCLGTAGWMVVGYNMLKSQYAERLLLSGGEVKPSTFQYGLMNLILTLKKFPYDVQCESSLTHINNNKHHLIWTNPPFATDKKFDELTKNFKHDRYTEKNNIKLDHVYKLQDDNPPIQFLELDLYKLEENGICFIVLPYGKLFFGDSYKKSRQYFMTETNITDIILFESGTFTHTGIKTAVIIFEKDKSGTKSINFLTANKECNKLTKITNVSREDIRKEMYESWYLRDYLKDEYIESLSCKMTKFEWADFGEIFTLEKGQIQSSKVEENETGEGNITFVSKCEVNEYTKKINSELYYNGGLFIANAFNGNGKCPIRYTEEKCIHSNLMSYFNINDKYKDRINIKYIYYFMKSIQEHIEKIYEKGSCNKSLDKKNFNRLKMPIPSLEEQSKIIEINDIMLNQINLLNRLKLESEKLLISSIEISIKTETEKDNTSIRDLIELSELKIGGTPSRDNAEYWENGENLWVSVSELNDNIITDTDEKITNLGVQKSNVKKLNKDTILLSFKLSIGKLAIAGKDLYTNEAIVGINSINEKIPNKYLYYCFKILDIKRFGRGLLSENGSLNLEQLKILKIPVFNNNKYDDIISDISIFEQTIQNYTMNITLLNNKLNSNIVKYLYSIK